MRLEKIHLFFLTNLVISLRKQEIFFKILRQKFFDFSIFSRASWRLKKTMYISFSAFVQILFLYSKKFYLQYVTPGQVRKFVSRMDYKISTLPLSN